MNNDILKAFESKDEGARQYYRALVRRSFYFHTKAVMGYHFSVAGSNLFDVETFKERQDFIQDVMVRAKRGLVEDPRAHVKSYGCTVAAPPWLAIQRPNEEYDHPNEFDRATKFLADHPHLHGVDSRLIIAADSVKRSMKWISTVMSVYIGNPLYRWLFPEVLWTNPNDRPAGQKWSEQAFHLPGRLNPGLADPFMWAAGLESKEQGGRSDGIFIEDIVGEQSYKSPTELERRKDYLDTITNLLENSNYRDARAGFVVINGNRWALDDVNSKVHDKLHHYEIWRRGAYRCFVHGTGSCGRWGSDDEKQCAPTDVPVWTAQYPDAAALEAVRLDKGEEVFACQWMNDPTAAAELDPNKIQPFLVDILSYTDPISGDETRGHCVIVGSEGDQQIIPLSHLTDHTISIDPASSAEVKAARSAIVYEALDRPTRRRFVIECLADRWKPDVVLTKIIDLYEQVVLWTNGVRPALICEKVAAQDYVGAGASREARIRDVRIPQIEMIPVPRNIRKADRQRRRLGDLLGQNLLYIKSGLNLPRYEVRHHPSGTSDTIDAICQVEDKYQKFQGTIDSERLARRRRRVREQRLASAGVAGTPLP